jgi:hypothetical protein
LSPMALCLLGRSTSFHVLLSRIDPNSSSIARRQHSSVLASSNFVGSLVSRHPPRPRPLARVVRIGFIVRSISGGYKSKTSRSFSGVAGRLRSYTVGGDAKVDAVLAAPSAELAAAGESDASTEA